MALALLTGRIVTIASPGFLGDQDAARAADFRFLGRPCGPVWLDRNSGPGAPAGGTRWQPSPRPIPAELGGRAPVGDAG